MTTATAHDIAACRLSIRQAAGFTETRNGVYINPLCRKCQTHHVPGACSALKDKAICPACKMNRRVLQHVYCESCLIDKGYSYVDLGEVQFWDKLPRVSLEGPDPDDLFDSLNGIEVAGRVAS